MRGCHAPSLAHQRTSSRPCLGNARVRPSRLQALLKVTPIFRGQLPVSRFEQSRSKATTGSTDSQTSPVFLSDLIRFETEAPGDVAVQTADPAVSSKSSTDDGDSSARVQATITRATKVLEAARQALKADVQSNVGPSSTGPGSAGQRPSNGQPASSSTSPTSSSDNSAAPRPSTSSGGSSGGGGDSSVPGPNGSSDGGAEPLTRRWSPLSDEQDLTRHVLQNALDQMATQPGSSGGGVSGPSKQQQQGPVGAGARGSGSSSSTGAGSSITSGSSMASGSTDDHGAPSWTQSFLSTPTTSPSSDYSFEPQLQATQRRAQTLNLDFAEPSALPTSLPLLLSQSEQDAFKARAATLPPLQSVVELTTAYKPPERGGAMPAEEGEGEDALPAAMGRQIADGSGVLPDGTRWEKKSGIELGKNGYWKRWHLLRGTSEAGAVEWEETWWEASDWTGMKELGALKSGRDAQGGAWRETWTERMGYTSNALDTTIERNAHKWAHDPTGDEWEEKWSEYYHSAGHVSKWADKWGKQGPNVWHERWGEDYDPSNGGDACVKWTDKWAERLLPGGAREQWGDKWREEFGRGAGAKNGEVWTVGADGHRYQRWWGEDHFGDGRVRRHGSSTSGESWDDTIHMDTYYNPIPHFGFKLALDHSPQLKGVPMRPRSIGDDGKNKAAAEDPFGPGLDDL